MLRSALAADDPPAALDGGTQDAYDTFAGIEDDPGALLGPRGPIDLRRALRRTADAQSAEDG